MKKTFLFLLVLVSNCFAQYIPQFLTQPSVGYQINLAHPDAQRLVMRLLFNEGLGLRVYDLSPFGNDGAMTNMDAATDWVAGRDGWALDFDGVDDRVLLPDVPEIVEMGSNLTLSAWINSRVLGVEDGILESLDGAFHGYQMVISSPADRVQFSLINASNNSSVASGAGSIVVNEWFYITATFDGTTMRIYINGDEKSSFGGASGEVFNVGEAPLIGYYNQGNAFFDGLIADVRIYRRAVTADEVMSQFIYQYAMFEQPPGRILAAAAAAAAGGRRRGIITIPN